MNKAQISSLKKDIAKLFAVAQGLADYYEDNGYQIIGTLLQNAAHDPFHCSNALSPEAELKKMETIGELLSTIHKYEDNYITNYFRDQYNMLLDFAQRVADEEQMRENEEHEDMLSGVDPTDFLPN